MPTTKRWRNWKRGWKARGAKAGKGQKPEKAGTGKKSITGGFIDEEGLFVLQCRDVYQHVG